MTYMALLLCFPLLVLASPPTDTVDASFRPAARILSTHCVRCHDADKTRGGLDLSSRDSALSGGATRDAIVPQQPEESFLIERIRAGSMPPERDGRRLTPDEVDLLADWIRQGASWPPGQMLPLPGEQSQIPATPQVRTTPSPHRPPSRILHRPFRRRFGR